MHQLDGHMYVYYQLTIWHLQNYLHIICLRSHFPNNTIKTIRLNNASEFTSQAFNDYFISIEINVEHRIAHVHTRNGLAESFIKRLQLITRSLLMKSKLSISSWEYAILHAAILI